MQCLPDGELVVRVPARMSRRKIMEHVQEKRAWIEKTRKRLQAEKEREEAMSLADGSVFLFLGREFLVRRMPPSAESVVLDLEEDRIEIYVQNESKARQALLDTIRQAAKTYLPIRTAELAEHMQLTYKMLRIKDQKTRWGSCSSLGNINLNARIMLAPPEVIDYLIVHELAHLVRMDHSRDFHGLVERYCPNHKKRQRWLREHGYLLRWAREDESA